MTFLELVRRADKAYDGRHELLGCISEKTGHVAHLEEWDFHGCPSYDPVAMAVVRVLDDGYRPKDKPEEQLAAARSRLTAVIQALERVRKPLE